MRRAFFVVHHFEEPHRKSFKTPPLPALLLLNQLHVSQKRETSMKDDSVSIFIVIQRFSSLIFNLLQCIQISNPEVCIFRNCLKLSSSISWSLCSFLHDQPGALVVVKGLTPQGCIASIYWSSAPLGYLGSSEEYASQNPPPTATTSFSV